jgi:GTP diphosphokinase / guanosine-3',5'-bis(diphosphate) 3'-diphosphatase
VGPEGRSVEIQIRTREMHEHAELGIAAHWQYKEGGAHDAEYQRKIEAVRRLLHPGEQAEEEPDVLESLRGQIFADHIYALTPKGEVVELPRGGTPLDFAYQVHSNLGHRCRGAKVNGRIVPLRSALKNGDVVEIMTQPGHVPSKDWLAFVKTARARNKIKHVINASERIKAIDIGEKYLEKEARRFGVQLGKIGKGELEKTAATYGYSKAEDLYAALGYGRYSARQILSKIAPEIVAEEAPESKPVLEVPPSGAPARQHDSDAVVKVRGIDDLLVYRAKCCNPIHGENIVGYVTRGKGVAVHSKMCPNVQNLMYDSERKIEVEWARAADDSFPVRIAVHTDDRPGMLNQLTSALFNESANIRSLEAKTNLDHDGALVEMTVDVRDKKQLEKLVASMRRISGVRDVERLH